MAHNPEGTPENNDATDMIVVRKMPFEFPEDINPWWHADKPEWSHVVNGTSLTMPYLEPYLIRTVKQAAPLIASEALREEAKLYCAQEAQHYQQHRRFHDMLIAHGYKELIDIEEAMQREYRELETGKSLKFNLAYACGFETMALGVGHWLVRDREYLFGGSDSWVASLALCL